MKILIAGLALSLGLANAATAFTDWTEQTFSLFGGGNDWETSATTVNMLSEQDVSLLWSPLSESEWGTRSASWNWNVTQSVPATQLTAKGGDDRNLAFYFVFMPRDIALKSKGESITSLLSVDEARIIMYVYGGNYKRGDILPSPYLGERGNTVVLRPAGTGAFSETVDLAEHYKRIYGSEPEALVGLAISGDSDDTGAVIRASLSDLKLQ